MTETYAVGSERWGADLRERALSLKVEADSAYMKLAEILYEVYDTPIDNDPNKPSIYKSWGYESFEEYALIELEIPGRKAQYLRRIFYVLNVELSSMPDHLRERIIALGYSKVRELVSVLTIENAEEWIRRAENCTFAELAELTKQYRQARKAASKKAKDTGTDPEDPDVPDAGERNSLKFWLYPSQLQIVEEALKAAGEIAHTDKKGELLTLICQDYLATNGAAPPGTERFRAYLDNLQQLFQVHFVAIDPRVHPHELLYGIENLEQLAATHGSPLVGEEEEEDDEGDSAAAIEDGD